MKYRKGSVRIEADEIVIGKKVRFGKNIDVKVRGKFELGDFSRLGDNCKIRGNNISFGKHFYNSSGLNIGGGGNQGERANLTVGDRCTFHNNFLNVCEHINIGNDVGLSQEVSIITHGYWQSVLQGFPRKFEYVTIHNGVILGYRTTVLPGVSILNDSVVGACSVVNKTLDKEFAVYAGNPAKFIRKIEGPSRADNLKTVDQICKKLGCELSGWNLFYDKFWCNVNTFEYGGTETERTDKFRDELRKYGIRIYTERPF